jgi:hypothetical protein
VLGIRAQVKIRIATEGALLGGLSGLHIAENMAIISDGAGQFNVLTHGLCWVHAERLIHKLQPLNDSHRDDIEYMLDRVFFTGQILPLNEIIEQRIAAS